MPNENYARELMELFSLGIGHYTETDIREAAKAFTGWEIKDRAATFDAAKHDSSAKAVLGQKGNWTGADIVRICLEQHAASPFIVGKLYRFLISETMPATPELIAPLAERFRKSNYDFGDLVQTMLRSNLFFAPQAYRAQVKSPVCFALGIIHALEGRTGTTTLVQALEELGQNVFYPPSVKGWYGGAIWRNGQDLLSRQNLALALTSTKNPRFDGHVDPAVLASSWPEVRRAARRVLPRPVLARQRQRRPRAGCFNMSAIPPTRHARLLSSTDWRITAFRTVFTWF